MSHEVWQAFNAVMNALEKLESEVGRDGKPNEVKQIHELYIKLDTIRDNIA